MKKKLLFSLLLGSTFSWINEMYATEEEATEQASTSNEIASKDVVLIKTQIEKAGVIGDDITVTYHKEDPENILYDNVVIQDGGIVVGPKHNQPFIPGIEGTPTGYKMINIWFPIVEKGSKTGWYGNYENDFSKAIIQTDNLSDFAQPSGYTGADDYMWMLMSDDNEIFIGELTPDENAKAFYGNEMYDATRKKADLAFVRKFKLPNKEATAKFQDAKKKLEEAEEQLKSGSNVVATSEHTSGGSVIAAPSGAPFWEKFQFGDGLFGGKRIDFVITTSDPKATPEAFAELKRKLLEMFSATPNVATAVFSLALEDISKLEAGKPESLRQIRIFGENISANLMFSSEVEPSTARAYIDDLMTKHSMSPDDVKELQREHEQKLVEYEHALADLEAERIKNEQMRIALEIAEKQAAEETLRAEEEKKRAEIAAELAAQALDEADEKEVEKVKIDQELEVIGAALTAAQIDEETLKGQKEAAEEALRRAEEEKMVAEDKLNEVHDKLIEAATTNSGGNVINNQEVLPPPSDDLPTITTGDDVDSNQEELSSPNQSVTTNFNSDVDDVDSASQLLDHQSILSDLTVPDGSSDEKNLDEKALVTSDHEEEGLDDESIASTQNKTVVTSNNQNDAQEQQFSGVDESNPTPIVNDSNNGNLSILDSQSQKDKVVVEPTIDEEALKESTPSLLEQSLAPYNSTTQGSVVTAEAG